MQTANVENIVWAYLGENQAVGLKFVDVDHRDWRRSMLTVSRARSISFERIERAV